MLYLKNNNTNKNTDLPFEFKEYKTLSPSITGGMQLSRFTQYIVIYSVLSVFHHFSFWQIDSS